MLIFAVVVVSVFTLLPECATGSEMCFTANWWTSFDRAGMSSCRNQHYIAGLERSVTHNHNEDYIYHIEGAQCCQGTGAYRYQTSHCLKADWVHSFDRTNTWNKCPEGYFLSGLERSGGNHLHNIEYGRCCKPQHSPVQYKDCYTANVWSYFDHFNHGMVSCGRHGYYITGLFRSTCDLVYCIEEFRCCSMR